MEGIRSFSVIRNRPPNSSGGAVAAPTASSGNIQVIEQQIQTLETTVSQLNATVAQQQQIINFFSITPGNTGITVNGTITSVP